MFKTSLFLVCGFVAVIGVSSAVYSVSSGANYVSPPYVTTSYGSDVVPIPAPVQTEQTVVKNYYQSPQPTAAPAPTSAPASSDGLLGIFDNVIDTAGRIAGGAVGSVLAAGGGILGTAFGGPKAGMEMASTGAGLGMALGNDIGDPSNI